MRARRERRQFPAVRRNEFIGMNPFSLEADLAHHQLDRAFLFYCHVGPAQPLIDASSASNFSRTNAARSAPLSLSLSVRIATICRVIARRLRTSCSTVSASGKSNTLPEQ